MSLTPKQKKILLHLGEGKQVVQKLVRHGYISIYTKQKGEGAMKGALERRLTPLTFSSGETLSVQDISAMAVKGYGMANFIRHMKRNGKRLTLEEVEAIAEAIGDDWDHFWESM